MATARPEHERYCGVRCGRLVPERGMGLPDRSALAALQLTQIKTAGDQRFVRALYRSRYPIELPKPEWRLSTDYQSGGRQWAREWASGQQRFQLRELQPQHVGKWLVSRRICC